MGQVPALTTRQRSDGSQSPVLGPALVARYHEEGFLLLRAVFAQDAVAGWVAECDRLASTLHPDNLRTHVLNSERPPDRLDPVVDVSPVLAALATSPFVSSVAGQLLGEEPALFKDKVIFKSPGAQGYRTHQDYAYWHWLPAPPDALVTVLVSIDGANAQNGAVEFFPGLHHRQLTPEGEPGDIDDGSLDTPGQVVETRPGDVVVFHSLTPHRSGTNQSSSMRRQLYLSYSAASYGDLYQLYYDNLHRTLRDGMPPEARGRAFFR